MIIKKTRFNLKLPTEKLVTQIVRISLIFLSLGMFAEFGLSTSKESEVVHIDEETSFAMLDHFNERLKSGDTVCFLIVKSGESICQIEPKTINRKYIFFMEKASLKKLEVGDKIILSKVYVQNIKKTPDNKAFAPLSVVKENLVEKERIESLTNSIPNELQTKKIPRGESVASTTESPEVATSEFPEIYIPKIKKRKKKNKKEETNPTDQIIKSIKKVFRKQDNVKYQFASRDQPLLPVETSDTDEIEERVNEDLPPDFDFLDSNPITHVLDVSFFQTLPVAPITSVQSVKFQTITNDNLTRDTLWAKGKQELSPVLGAGFEVNFTRSLTNLFSMGWRYHLFEKAKSKATFDQFSLDQNTYTETKVDTFAIHIEWGKQYKLWDNFTHKFALGPELYQSSIEFKAVTVNETTESRDLQAYATSSFGLLGLRAHYAWKFQIYGYGLIAGIIGTVPLSTFKETFEGEISVPVRLTYTGEGAEEIKKALKHEKSTYGAEVYFGINYQPSR